EPRDRRLRSAVHAKRRAMSEPTWSAGATAAAIDDFSVPWIQDRTDEGAIDKHGRIAVDKRHHPSFESASPLRASVERGVLFFALFQRLVCANEHETIDVNQ